MFRKTIFITVSIFKMGLFAKAVILISFSFVSFFLVMVCRPFILHELNTLEFQANISAIITLYSGTLYMNDISKEFKAILFFLIVMTNITFFINFFMNTLYLFLTMHFERIHKFCPYFIDVIANLMDRITWDRIRKSILNRSGAKTKFETLDSTTPTPKHQKQPIPINPIQVMIPGSPAKAYPHSGFAKIKNSNK